jgi:GAF domain-containing protein
MTVKAGKNLKRKKGLYGHFEDILNVARLLGSSTVPEKVLETVLSHLCERLGKRARCAFLEGDELRLRFWAGEYVCPVGGLQVRRDSIVWDVVKKGVAMNLTEPGQTAGYPHTLGEPIGIKAVIPLRHVDPITGEETKLGALIVDSGKEGTPISGEDFEYLQVIAELLSAIMGRVELVRQLMASCRRQETILTETAHNFRNRIVAIGGFSRHIEHLAQGTELGEQATRLYGEVKELEAHLAVFEKYMSLKESPSIPPET